MKNRELSITGEVKVEATLQEVWNAWTTEEGIKSFFAPACDIEIHPDGKYEIYFDPNAPEGEKGGEGLKVMAVQPMKMFSFTWNAPPTLPKVRGQRTHVVIRFFPEKEGTTVTLCHDGWGTGGEWEDAYNYFQIAWCEIVLPRLRYRFKHGPINWANPPDKGALGR
ncbi:MAG: SRPBCC domain-containing protein [Proteobacteria bacterium]|nr:SRPBCC domain-containing protein [Pseudomonadota bacterium]